MSRPVSLVWLKVCLACAVLVFACIPAAAQAPAQTPPPSDRWFFPFAIFVVNANVNSGALLPGGTAVFALPEGSQRDREQFNVSPGNSYFGAEFRFPPISDTRIGAKVDFTLRGAKPLQNQNTFAPLFGDIYLDLTYEPLRFVFGQAPDVVSPLLPTTLNTFPWSYTPGSLGFFRPQVRVETKVSVGDSSDLMLQGALAQAIQTFDIAEEAVATQSGWPDIQARAGLGVGEANATGQRKIEIGVWGHFGERNLTLRSGSVSFNNTYSFGFDGRVQVLPRTKVQGEYFTGQLVGDYMGAIFQTFDPISGIPVDAQGFWAEVEHGVTERLQVHVGYGVDNVEEEGGLAQLFARNQNSNVYGNLFIAFSPELTVAGEVAWWRTKYRGLDDGQPFRFEMSIIYKWLGR
jgi:hypothetical protein